MSSRDSGCFFRLMPVGRIVRLVACSALVLTACGGGSSGGAGGGNGSGAGVTIIMPDIIGLSEGLAIAAIERDGLRVGLIRSSGEAGGAEPTVISASWPSGAELVPGDVVDFSMAPDPAYVSPIALWQSFPRGARPAWHGDIVDNRFRFAVGVTSTYLLDSGFVTVGGDAYEMSYYTEPPSPCDYDACYARLLDITGSAPGDTRLVARVTDTRGNYAEVSVLVQFDQRPTLTITKPLNDTLAQPQIDIDVACSDNAPGCRLQVFAPSEPGNAVATAEGIGSISTRVDLSAWTGAPVDVLFRAIDATNQATEVTYRIYVENPGRLSPVVTVPDDILDVRGSRVLHAAGDGLAIYSIAQQETESLQAGDGWFIDDRYALLTDSGAVFAANTGPGDDNYLRIYSNGSLLSPSIGADVPLRKLAASGAHAAFSVSNVTVRDTLRLDPSTGVASAISIGSDTFDLADDGTIVFVDNVSALVRDRPGESQLVLAADSGVLRGLPRTDGATTLYIHSTLSPSQRALALVSEGTMPVLLSPLVPVVDFDIDDHLVSNGWVAYTQGEQIYRRSPSGVVEQITDFNAGSQLLKLGENGDIVFANSGRMFLSRGDTVTDIASSFFARSFRTDGQWFVALGATLAAVDTSDL